MKKAVFVGCLILPALLVSGQALLKDGPLKGEWNFSPEKIWEAGQAGDEAFGRVAELLVLDDGSVFLRDFEKNVSYLFDKDGRFLKTFAPQGKDDGQLPFYLNRFRAGGKIVLASPDKLHFFSRDGVFERAVENNLFLRFPLRFTSESEFIYAPNFPQSPVHEKILMSFDIISGQGKTLVDFSKAAPDSGPVARGPMLMSFSLTPQVRFASDEDKMAFGRSDQYEIFIADQAGSILTSFRLDRKRMTASLEDKRRQVAGTRLPEEQKEKVVAQLPDEMTYFSHIEMIKGRIYVFAVDRVGEKTDSQQVDIFSSQGEYLYRGRIEFGDGLEFGSPSNLVITDGHAYVILEDGQGRRTLAKYAIKLPL